MNKILINTPKITLPGGVANHYLGLKPYWNQKVKYNEIGKRSNNFLSKGWIYFPADIIKFIFVLGLFKPDLVLLNPSLGKNAIPRDMIFLWISKLLGFKCGVFIHGWDYNYEKHFNNSNWLSILRKADVIFVLATEFRNKLLEIGATMEIFLTTTKVDDNLILNFLNQKQPNRIFNILFLARIEKYKGIYIATAAFEIIKKTNSNVRLTIVGSGSELKNLKKYCKERALDKISFKGHLKNDALIKEFQNADVYLFPTYAEGMPTSVLEAMAFGLPIITRSVGGLADFFNKNMGYITHSKDPQYFADSIIELINNPILSNTISLYNHQYAKSNFMASTVAKKLEEQINKIINK